ncbi:MAG: nucleotide exchange factor GrpE [Paludibacteraceae bacterium]|jgi:molecular chaperone GrpE|nr:nucleotide exchange factor GrpE [Paludibacteraceae bacterium]MBO7723912.1 nucleotide exchange factor GrpE [Paludibacteraceae bacterium]
MKKKKETIDLESEQKVEIEAQEQTETAQQEVSEVEKLRAENQELNDKYIRKVAEFENYRKNMLKQQSELIKNGGERVFVDMLPLIDDFERALKAIEKTEETASLYEGVELIYNKFITFLNKNGVKEIVTENVEFDTDFHEAVTTFPAPSEEMKNKIIDCVSKGYTMNEKVIRYAKVVVGQ